MKMLTIGLLCIATCSVAMAGGNPSAGKSKALLCAGCHGIDGNSTSSQYPALAGQGENYLLKQFNDFKSGARKDSHMTPMIEALNKADYPDVAAYFATQTRKPEAAPAPTHKAGEEIFHKGISARSVSACSSCHGENGKGNDAIKFPLLAGQHADYIKKILKDFRAGQRSNDTGSMMRNIAADLKDEDIDALAAYISAMK